MKISRAFTLLIVMAWLFVAVVPANAQIGASDIAAFTIQNVDTVNATVWVTFVDEDGDQVTPNPLNNSKPNPFTLEVGKSFEVVVPNIPSLPSGRYSVIISSDAQVVAIAQLLGQGGPYFTGSYSSFSSGDTTFYLPGAFFNWYGWYSLISVQNLSDNPADITLEIRCNNGASGTLTRLDLPGWASHHFDLETTTPSSFTAPPAPGATQCSGSAKITSDQPVVAADNQSVSSTGHMQSYNGVSSGYNKLFAPALYTNSSTWYSSITVRKLQAGPTQIRVDYSDATSDSLCNLTDATPQCEFYMGTYHPTRGKYSATIYSNPAMEIAALVGAGTSAVWRQALAYNAIGEGSTSQFLPSMMKYASGWITSFACQNVGGVNTKVDISYSAFGAFAGHTYEHATTLTPNSMIEVEQRLEGFLPMSYKGSATVTAKAAGAQIACIANFNQPAAMVSLPGDWSMSYNAFKR